MSFSFGEDLEKLSKQDTVELTGYSAIKFPHTHLSDESSVEPSVILENLSTDLISKNSATSDPSQNPWNTRTKTSASNLNLKTVAMHSRDTRLGNKENMIPAESKYTFRARSKRENSENMKSQFGPRRGRRKLIDQSKLNEISSIVLSLENSSRLTEDELTMNSVAPESDTAFLNKRPTKMVIRGRRKLRALFDNRSGFELSLERSAVLPAQVGGSVMFDVSDKFPSVTVTRSDESVSTVTGESALSVAAETGTEICKSVPNLNSFSRSASRDPTNPHVVEKVPNVRSRRAMKRSTRVTLRGRRNLGGALGDGSGLELSLERSAVVCAEGGSLSDKLPPVVDTRSDVDVVGVADVSGAVVVVASPATPREEAKTGVCESAVSANADEAVTVSMAVSDADVDASDGILDEVARTDVNVLSGTRTKSTSSARVLSISEEVLDAVNLASNIEEDHHSSSERVLDKRPSVLASVSRSRSVSALSSEFGKMDASVLLSETHVTENVSSVDAHRAAKRSTRVTLRGRRNLGGALGDGSGLELSLERSAVVCAEGGSLSDKLPPVVDTRSDVDVVGVADVSGAVVVVASPATPREEAKTGVCESAVSANADEAVTVSMAVSDADVDASDGILDEVARTDVNVLSGTRTKSTSSGSYVDMQFSGRICSVASSVRPRRPSNDKTDALCQSQSLSGSPLVLKSALASRHQKRSSRRVSFQPVDKSHAWNSNDDSRASSTKGCSSVQEDSCETKTSSSHWKSRMPDPLRGRFIPFKSQRSPSQSLLASNLKLRRSKRVRAPTVCDPHIRVVHDFVLASDGYPYSTPIGVQVEPTDDDIRRYQRAQKRLKLIDEARDNSGLRKRLRQRRTQRLQALARLYRRSADRSESPSQRRPRIRLDHGVQWAQEGQFSIPMDPFCGISDTQVIFPGDCAPPLFGRLVSCSLYTVPSMANVWSCDSSSRPTVRLQALDNITLVATSQQEHHQLHLDPQNTNLFRITEIPSEAKAGGERPLLAVQVNNLAFNIDQPVYIMIPAGVTYKFINASNSDLKFIRSIFYCTQ